ncbi:hypothetical protein [Microtetraspora malaysiensis]|uniref:hypothetical protein n=1 Tax=Microtetraspora malaysiensis TaxID=161358 RepID=UPI003D8D73A4
MSTAKTRTVAPVTSCALPHLPPMRSDVERLAWHATRRFARFRVLAWTCHEHRATWYELCQGGGVWFIQRMSGDPLKPSVAQSHAWREAEARQMWVALLFGVVR